MQVLNNLKTKKSAQNIILSLVQPYYGQNYKIRFKKFVQTLLDMQRICYICNWQPLKFKRLNPSPSVLV